ncbi:piggyBac transposable element-derived protein 4-like [Patiria miniata]|uniref:PiggyBac transposable element-derived protein domain-containing protein n=1 Tax=Patiria miniata TaxID=46514 RepID=A0A913ZZ55_PATMI|nr:piggyBac transposable element-derived protein 4-like [Patiria miniata]
MNIAQGMDRRSHLRDYWSNKPWLRTQWYGEIFAVNEYMQIHRYLHSCNNNDYDPLDGNRDKLFKVRYIIDKLSTNFKEAYVPGMHISVDEQMIGSKCHVSFVQYMPQKPKKFGIKLWVLADSENGYCSRFQVYTGRVENAPEVGLPSRVVNDLPEDFRNQGYHLYTDNFYTSPTSCINLLRKDILSCGTVRVNRIGFPKELKPKPREKFEKGSMEFRKCGNLTAVRWKDKRDVTALSTIHCNDVQVIPPRRDEANEVKKHLMIYEYNQHMGGVDQLDQYLCYYTVGRRTLKWWKRLFWRLLELAIINSYILFKEVIGKPALRQKDFREGLVLQLTETYRQQRTNRDDPNLGGRPGRRRSTPLPLTVMSRVTSRHPSTTSTTICFYERAHKYLFYSAARKNWRMRINLMSGCEPLEQW